MIMGAELIAIGQWFGENGIYIAVIALLLRANHNKDRIISELSANAMELAKTAQHAVRKLHETGSE